MGRRKRNSNALELAHARLNGLKSIDPQLDLGNGLTVAALETAVNLLQTKLDNYNQKLSEVDEELIGLKAIEAELKELAGRFLAGVGARYGRNSVQYGKAGGIRTDERKHSSRKPGSGSGSEN